jgi:hypothetical protein
MASLAYSPECLEGGFSEVARKTCDRCYRQRSSRAGAVARVVPGKDTKGTRPR